MREERFVCLRNKMWRVCQTDSIACLMYLFLLERSLLLIVFGAVSDSQVYGPVSALIYIPGLMNCAPLLL